jgi:hypothetical protein
MNAFMGAGGLGIGISDFDGKEGVEGFPGVLRGGNIRLMSTGEAAIAGFGSIPPDEAIQDWGSEWKKAALKWHDHAGTISSEAEHLAYRQNCLDLDPTYTDKFGDPLARMTLDWIDHERGQGAMLAKIHGYCEGDERAVGRQQRAAAGALNDHPIPEHAREWWRDHGRIAREQCGESLATALAGPESAGVRAPWLTQVRYLCQRILKTGLAMRQR